MEYGLNFPNQRKLSLSHSMDKTLDKDHISYIDSCDALELLNSTMEYDTDHISKLLFYGQQRRQEWCKSIAASVVPVYVTSVCSENCSYCNFRRSNRSQRIERRRLTTVELERELTNLIHERGYRAVELVYASDPEISSSKIAAHVALCRRMLDATGKGIIGINVHPLSIDDYKLLVDSGLDFAVQWQETYDRKRYAIYHDTEGDKSNFEYRFTAYERMLLAGVQNIGVGILFGLAPWREDVTALLRHEVELFRRFGKWPAILGTARLKPALGAQIKRTQFVPTDEEFIYAIFMHSLLIPSTVPWVNTREPWDLCVKLAQGGCLFTFDCSTTPGGYCNEKPSYQFPAYNFQASVFAEEIKNHGLKAEFSWQFGKLGGLEIS